MSPYRIQPALSCAMRKSFDGYLISDSHHEQEERINK